MWSRFSLRLRLAVQSAVIVGMVVALASFIEYRLVTSALLGRVDEQLAHTAGMLQIDNVRDPITHISPKADPLPDLAQLGIENEQVHFQLVKKNGDRAGYSSIDIPFEDEVEHSGSFLNRFWYNAEIKGVRYRVLAMRSDIDDYYLLLIARSVEEVLGIRGRLTTFLWMQAIFTTLTAFFLGYLVTREAMRPAHQMAVTARDIAVTGDLAKRVVEGAADRDLANLTAAFNRMLDKIEDAYDKLAASLEAERRFVADASHELRTPLTTILGNTGYLGRTSADPEAVRDIKFAADRLNSLVVGLTTLAREDARVHEDVALVDFDELVRDIAAEPEYSSFVCSLNVRDDVWVQGNEESLAIMVRNLLGNAVKYGTSRVDLTVTIEDEEAVLIVSDDGPGIDVQDVERVFHRFWRAPKAKSKTGSGLGLSIVKATVDSHGGTVEACPGPGGRIVVRLPIADPPVYDTTIFI